ncbi:FAD dependent oxidoreductase [Mycotypha africana]|uniref:FAD dependent oxidoreductase n=1 Tax=Mycotypha africana TaxID=64632 RepID=UPI0023010115|nr:FAD dependent oxidoreductase [Mycotypha africana]KAI8991304.1 FAD dependent oxidoreductase [Mycotypha africana]
MLIMTLQNWVNRASHLARPTLFGKTYATSRTPDIQVDNVVIGAGVIGLAIGEKITRERPRETTVVIDKNGRIGEETSARNSGVIHAGLYYPENSLKTKLCIRGNRMLYDLFRCTENIPYKRLGKWVVAQNEEQHQYLQSLHEKANKLGVETHFLDQNEANKQEPDIKAHSVLVSPNTGIFDPHAFMDHLELQITQAGANVVLGTKVNAIRTYSNTGGNNGYLLDLTTQDQESLVLAKRVFNSGGLHADKISNMLLGEQHYKLYYARGHYYAYGKSLPVKHLIYPCPEKNLSGLGTHLTLDLAGRSKFGPDVQYIDSPYNYNFPDDDTKKEAFVNAIQTYLPSIKKENLHADFSGIRPKLAGPGEPFRDFVIKEELDTGFDNFFTLLGIESPGLTSSLAIADYVYSLVRN